MNTQTRCTRTARSLSVGAAAAVPMLFFASGIASATDAVVSQDGPGSLKVHITGVSGPGYISGADNCSVWLDRDPANDPPNNPNPTGGAPAAADNTVDFHKLGADVSQPHTVWIKCYHAGKQTSFWDAERSYTPSTSAAPEAPAAQQGPATSAGATFKGTYTMTAIQANTETWVVTPCGPGCATVVASGPRIKSWSATAQFVNGKWQITVSRPDAVKCPDGSTAPGTTHYSVDGSLTGGTLVTDYGAVCGGQPGTTPIDVLTLTKA